MATFFLFFFKFLKLQVQFLFWIFVLLEQMFAQNLGAAVGPNLAVMKTTRQTVDGINAKLGTNLAYMYGYTFLFFEQYLHSSHDLYMVVGLALGTPYCTLQFPFTQVLSIIHELASTHIRCPCSNCSTYIVTPI